MDIIKYTHMFQNVETQNDFFNHKDQEDFKYWDIVRYAVFSTIYRELTGVKLIKAEKQNLAKRLVNGMLSAQNYVKFLIASNFKTYKYLCFICSRHKIGKNLSIDSISEDILSIIGKEALLMETYQINEGGYYYKSYFETGKKIYLMFKKFSLAIQKNDPFIFQSSQILKDKFGAKIDLDALMEELIRTYKLEYKYYSRFIKKINPDLIFISQNGIQKGIFASANKLKVPTVELQHGLIGYMHPTYSYPVSIQPGQLTSLPKYLFTFSDFWTSNFNCPIENIIPIGNTSYSKRITNQKMNDYALTVIFVETVATDLINFIDALLALDFDRKICLKLHPNLTEQSRQIRNHFLKFDNVVVIVNELTIKELLSTSDSIFAVYSTCVYEALQDEVKVILYKIKDYHSHMDVFDNPNIYLVDIPEELIEVIDNDYVRTDQPIFFQDFNRDYFLKFLNQMN
jgi:hypothetical protein